MKIPVDLLARNILELQKRAWCEGYDKGFKEGLKRYMGRNEKDELLNEQNNERFAENL